MVEFTSVTAEGFGSYIKPTKFKLNRPGLNIVIGDNGVGKTTAFSALRWGLTGLPLKNIKSVTTWPKLQPKGFLGTNVVIKFKKAKDKYEVIRLKDYKGKVLGKRAKKDGLYLIVNGVEWTESSKKQDIQEEIYRIIGMNDDLLMGSVIFGQRMKKLIESSGPDKKRVFEEAFSAGFIKEALDNAKSDYKDSQADLAKLENDLAHTEDRIEDLEARIAQDKEFIKNWYTDHREAILDVENDIKANKAKKFGKTNTGLVKAAIEEHKIRESKLEKELEDYQRAIEKEAESINKDLRKAQQIVTIGQETVRVIEGTLKDLYSKKPKCKICGSGLSTDKINQLKAMEEKRLKEVESSLNRDLEKLHKIKGRVNKQSLKYKNDIDSLKKSLKSINLDIRRNTEELSIIESNKRDKKRTTSYINDLEKKLVKLKKQEPPKEKYLEEDKKKLAKLRDSIKKETKRKKALTKEVEGLKWLIGDMLSNKGLKAYIFDRMLIALNDKLAYYQQFIGYRVKFAVDLEGGNKDIYAMCHTQDGHEAFYEELSGGEKQLVDAATAFAMFDVISANRPVNLLVFDEPFEGLTEENTEILTEIIQEKSRGKSVYLVSHNIDLQQSSHKVIRMKKSNGETVLKQL